MSGLDSVTHIAGFVGIISEICSMALRFLLSSSPRGLFIGLLNQPTITFSFLSALFPICVSRVYNRHRERALGMKNSREFNWGRRAYLRLNGYQRRGGKG
ncbi:hypothetical protein JOM56_010113 [Amanita muscaria]